MITIAIIAKTQRKLDNYNRISIPSNYLKTLDIDKDDNLDVILDTSNKIIIKKNKINKVERK